MTSRRSFLHLTGAAAGLAMLRLRAGAQERAATLRVHQSSPYNAEPAIEALVQEWGTPVGTFYVRNHGKDIPRIDAASFKLTVEGLVDKPQEFTLKQLEEKFRPTEGPMTLTCAGNRRTEHSKKEPVSGVQWEAGAIANATWLGAKLGDVLKAVGVQSKARHVWFEGLDTIEHGDHTTPFGGSIPLEKALADDKKAMPVILATAMNGAPLTEQHGAPLRALVPGYIGARSVKWLGKVTVSESPSPNHFLAGTYKLIERDDPKLIEKALPIYENVINSAICVPATGASIVAGMLRVQGYALPSGSEGATIKNVELSIDGGESWRDAKLGEESQAYCWRHWFLDVKLPKGKHSLVARATDSRGQSQPKTTPWNAKGYLYNAYHRVDVEIV